MPAHHVNTISLAELTWKATGSVVKVYNIPLANKGQLTDVAADSIRRYTSLTWCLKQIPTQKLT